MMALAAMVCLPVACKMLEPKKGSYSTDRLSLAKDFEQKSPANLVILPVEAADTMDFQNKNSLREICYSKLLKKGYAPLSLSFTDRTLRDLGRYHTPLSEETVWNADPFKAILAEYCDALVLVSIERYLESGQPGRSGIVVWGKVGVFDSSSMELLYEHYTRQTLHPTDPGGGRDRYIQKALEEFTELLLRGLPGKNPPRA
jgi:hypothetical protein